MSLARLRDRMIGCESTGAVAIALLRVRMRSLDPRAVSGQRGGSGWFVTLAYLSNHRLPWHDMLHPASRIAIACSQPRTQDVSGVP